MNIRIISASVRDGRNSHRVALYFQNYITANNLASVDIIDLKERQFPLFNERLQYMKNPPQNLVDLSQEIKSADAVLIVTPEYNGGYPAALKNVVDLLYPEWKKKPIAIATVSQGPFAGTQVITSLLFTLWKIGAWVVPPAFPVAEVEKQYTENGEATNKAAADKKAKQFIGELLWAAEAAGKMSGNAK